jgi:hypothetical protein
VEKRNPLCISVHPDGYEKVRILILIGRLGDFLIFDEFFLTQQFFGFFAELFLTLLCSFQSR